MDFFDKEKDPGKGIVMYGGSRRRKGLLSGSPSLSGEGKLHKKVT